MSDQFELNAEVREDMGKGASRRLRRPLTCTRDYLRW